MRLLLLLFGLLLVVAFVESQGRRGARRFPLRGRTRPNAAAEQPAPEKEETSPNVETEAVSEPQESPKTVARPRRPSRRRTGGLRRRPSRVRSPKVEVEEKVKEEEVSLDEKVLSAPSPPKPSSRRGLRVRIPKRPKLEPVATPLEPAAEKEKMKMELNENMDIMEKKSKPPKTKSSKPLPILKAEMKDKKKIEHPMKEEKSEILAKEKVAPVKPPIKFRPLPIKTSRGDKRKPTKKEDKKVMEEPTAPEVKVPKEAEVPKHRFSGRVPGLRRKRPRGRGRVPTPKASPAAEAGAKPEGAPEEKPDPEPPKEPQLRAPVRRRLHPRLNRKRPPPRKQEVLPVEEAQEERAPPVAEEAAPLEVQPEQLDKSFPDLFELKGLLAQDEDAQPTTELPIATTTLASTLFAEHEKGFSTIHKIPKRDENLNLFEDDLLLEAILEEEDSPTTEEPKLGQGVQINPTDFLLSTKEDTPLDAAAEEEVFQEAERSIPLGPKGQKLPAAKEEEASRKLLRGREHHEAPAAARPLSQRPSGRRRISRKKKKPMKEEPIAVPILLPEDPRDAQIPSAFPLHSYGPQDITFKGGEVVIREKGTREDSPPQQVRAILSGLGSRRRGLARPPKKVQSPQRSPVIPKIPQSKSPRKTDNINESSLKVSDPDIDYIYEYYDAIYEDDPFPLE